MKREVSNEEYAAAYANAKNRRYMKMASRRYIKVLDADTLEECEMLGLLATLQYHDDSYGQKFTTNLFHFVCLKCRSARKMATARKRAPLAPLPPNLPARPKPFEDTEDELSAVQENMSYLSRQDRLTLTRYYLEGYSLEEIAQLEGCTSEKLRTHMRRATVRLRELCLNEDG